MSSVDRCIIPLHVAMSHRCSIRSGLHLHFQSRSITVLLPPPSREGCQRVQTGVRGMQLTSV